MNLRKIFIENLKRYRKEKSLSQMKLAELCNTATSYIGEIESGLKFPSIDMVQKISETLDLPAYKFFIDDNGQKDSHEMSYHQMSPEFLLSGILREGRNGAVRILAALGMDTSSLLQKLVEETIKSEFPFSCDTKE